MLTHLPLAGAFFVGADSKSGCGQLAESLDDCIFGSS